MQVGRDGNQPTAPLREYTIWRGDFGVWDSHTPVVNDNAGNAVSPVIRSQLAAAVPGVAPDDHPAAAEHARGRTAQQPFDS